MLLYLKSPSGPSGLDSQTSAPAIPPKSGVMVIRRRSPAWGQGMIDTAKAARKFFNAKPDGPNDFPVAVNGFTGSSIWHSIYAFPPTDQNYWNKGFEDFANRFGPILDAFEAEDVNFALEVHPTEIAFDIASAQRAIGAVGGHKRFGFNYDPSHRLPGRRLRQIHP